MARHLLNRELRDWRIAAQRYLLHLVLIRATARHRGTAQDIERLNDKIKEHLYREQIPKHWRLDYLFSEEGYKEYGPGIFPCWVVALLHLCRLERDWCQILRRERSTDPYRLPGFTQTPDPKPSSSYGLRS